MTDHSTPSGSRLSGLRVLVAEDEMLLAVELVDKLDELGATAIGPMPSVDNALAAIAEQQIDAAMINVHLRGQLSFLVGNALRDRNIPFIFVTGNDAFVQEHFPGVPAHPKPYDMATIVEALELLVRKTGPEPV